MIISRCRAARAITICLFLLVHRRTTVAEVPIQMLATMRLCLVPSILHVFTFLLLLKDALLFLTNKFTNLLGTIGTVQLNCI